MSEASEESRSVKCDVTWGSSPSLSAPAALWIGRATTGPRSIPFGHASRSAERGYADIVATGQRRGRTMSALDVQIAAICRQHDATLATRNITDFEALKLTLVNPWSEPEG
jgi:hypothetical protein